ncbi:MAG: hypothetical protein HUU50_04230 [Candidatus Brocadiae bacterium]|nr:hypothetical protein [Candidatus Brocadiia bacterium]
MNYLTQTESNLLNINSANDTLGDLISIIKIDHKENRGKLLSNIGLIKDRIEFIWLALSRSKILWKAYDSKEKQPQALCKSFDGVQPNGGITMRNALCSNCPDSQWANGKPPLCCEIFNMLCLDVETQSPFIYGVKRTGIKSLRLLKAQIRHSQSIPFAGIPAHLCFKIELKPKAENTYFIPQFTILTQCSEQESKFYHDLAIRFTQVQAIEVDPEDLNGNGTH